MQLYKKYFWIYEEVFIICITLLVSSLVVSLALLHLGSWARVQRKWELHDLVKNTTEYNEVVFIYYYSLATKDDATCVEFHESFGLA